MTGADAREPPRLAHRLLRRLAAGTNPRDDASATQIEASLTELYRRRLERDGRRSARAWYWRQVAGFVLRWRSIRAAGAGPGERRGSRPPRGEWLRDLAYAARSLRRQPAFTALAIGTLAIGIAANAIVFTVLDGALFRPLPIPHAERLVSMRLYLPEEDWPAYPSHAQFEAWRARVRDSVDAMVGYQGRQKLLRGPDNAAEEITTQVVSPGFFELLEVQPTLGRTFAAGDYRPDASPVAVISHDLWQERFAGDRGTLGAALEINALRHTVVGVLPADFRFETFEAAVYQPLKPTGVGASGPDERINAVARLRPGAGRERLAAEMAAATIGRGAAALVNPDAMVQPVVQTLREDLYGWVGERFGPFMGVVAFVLLLVAANLANLTLVRAANRGRELALRAALGAGRWRLARLVGLEILLLTSIAASIGVLLAYWGVTVLVRLDPLGVSRTSPSFNLRVVVFAAAAALFAGSLAALGPGIAALRTDFRASLRHDSGHSTAAGRHRITQRGLVVVQIAASLLLLTGAGLLTKTTLAMQLYDPGIDTHNLLRFRVELPERYADRATRQSLAARSLERIEALPGVISATMVGSGESLSFGLTPTSGGVTIEGHSERLPVSATTEMGSSSYVPANYFETLGIPLLQGRVFSSADVAGETASVAIINQRAARRWWPDGGGEVVGRRLKLGPPESAAPWLTVVGVVGDTNTVAAQAIEWEFPARVYLPFAIDPGASRHTFYARTSADPTTLIPSLRRALAEIDDDLLVRNPTDQGEVLGREIGYYRVNGDIVTVFAAFAVVLAAMGVYGVVAYGVARRTREIGVRIALGARDADVLGTVSRESAALAAAGIVVGLALSAAFTRGLESMLYGIDPLDPWVFALAATFFAAVVALASYVPARRATRIDPMIALRSE